MYFLATEETEALNRRAFKDMAADFLGISLLKIADFQEWGPIFQVLADSAGSQKLVIVIDEFQYL